MKNPAILLVFVILTITCSGQKKKYSYSDKTFNRIDFSEVTFTLDKKTKDTIQIEGILKQKTIIDGIPCYANISFAKDWELKKFTLADEHTFAEYTFPKDTYIGFKVDISSINSGHFLEVVRDTLNICRFKSNQIINGLSCEGEEVIFTPEWNLRACILGDDDTIAGNVFKKSTLAVFAEDGRFSVYCLYDPIVQTYHCSGTNYKFWGGGGGIFFYPNGQLRLFKPVDDVEVQGVFCKKKCIWFYENGKLQRCTSAKDQTIDGVLYKKKLTLKFDEDGNITESYKDSFF